MSKRPFRMITKEEGAQERFSFKDTAKPELPARPSKREKMQGKQSKGVKDENLLWMDSLRSQHPESTVSYVNQGKDTERRFVCVDCDLKFPKRKFLTGHLRSEIHRRALAFRKTGGGRVQQERSGRLTPLQAVEQEYGIEALLQEDISEDEGLYDNSSYDDDDSDDYFSESEELSGEV